MRKRQPRPFLLTPTDEGIAARQAYTKSLLAEAEELGYKAPDNGIDMQCRDAELKRLISIHRVSGVKMCNAWQRGWNRRAKELGLETYEPVIYDKKHV